MSFDKLINPRSIAVVGASKNPQKVGYSLLANIVEAGFEGPVYPVNPKEKEISGLKCYSSLHDIPESIDLTVIAVKRELVLDILNDCVAKSIRAVVTITAGFAEVGEEGRRLQNEMVQIARRGGITMLGPNCLGIINPWVRLNASFGQACGHAGSIALISQSGALITSVQDWALEERIGFSVVASIGNKAMIDEVDFLENLLKHEQTKVIAAYLEDIGRGQQFMRIAERVSKEKPIVILKAGKTMSGAKAASSHTGSLAGADVAYNCAFERCGVIRADSVEHLFDLAVAFAQQPLPTSDRIGVVTNAGGPGIMMTDALELEGLKLAELDEETRKRLRQKLPEAASVRNPVDVLGDADGERYGIAVKELLDSPSVDGVIVVLTPQRMTNDVEIAQAIIEVSKRCSKPLFACCMGAEKVKNGVALLRQNGIPHYPVPERAAAAMVELVKFSRYKSRPLRIVERFAVNKYPVAKIFNSYRARNATEIGEYDAKLILRAYNFDLPSGALVNSAEEAVRFAEQTGYPLAMKISSPDILHKSDVGGVKVGISSAKEVEDTFELMMLRIRRKMPGADIKGILVEKMISGGKEVIIGMKKDPQFGPMLMFGLGGIFVEVLKDISFSLAPITQEECRQMIMRTRSVRLLEGVRGERGVDIEAIVTAIQRLSQLVMDFPIISEVDINPLKVGYEGDGAFVVDARIIIERT